jgi:hypothetical protein
MKFSRIALVALPLALALALALVPAALAGKGAGAGAPGGGKKGGGGGGTTGGTGGTTYAGSFVGANPILVSDNNGNGSVNYGDVVTFNVSSNAPYYYVRLDCSQSGTLVWEGYAGFYVGWLWGTTYTLAGQLWHGGAANCTAQLYSQNADGTNTQNLATNSFTVAG